MTYSDAGRSSESPTISEPLSATLFDAALHYRISDRFEVYGLVENMTDQNRITSRDPYGARPGKPRTFMAGVKFAF